jgi:hypothetical protein
MEKTPNYTDSQVAVIRSVAAENGGVLNLDLVKAIAARSDMNTADGGERNYKSVVAKVSQMARAGEFTYERKVATTKDGRPVTKKTDLVARIAAAANVTVAKLDGLDKASKGALEILASFAEAA